MEAAFTRAIALRGHTTIVRGRLTSSVTYFTSGACTAAALIFSWQMAPFDFLLTVPTRFCRPWRHDRAASQFRFQIERDSQSTEPIRDGTLILPLSRRVEFVHYHFSRQRDRTRSGLRGRVLCVTGMGWEFDAMSIDKSLRRKNSLERARSVLTRAERIQKLKEQEKWVDGRSPFGLPKVRVVRLVVKKSKKEKAAEAAGGEAAAKT